MQNYFSSISSVKFRNYLSPALDFIKVKKYYFHLYYLKYHIKQKFLMTLLFFLFYFQLFYSLRIFSVYFCLDV